MKENGRLVQIFATYHVLVICIDMLIDVFFWIIIDDLDILGLSFCDS